MGGWVDANMHGWLGSWMDGCVGDVGMDGLCGNGNACGSMKSTGTIGMQCKMSVAHYTCKRIPVTRFLQAVGFDNDEGPG